MGFLELRQALSTHIEKMYGVSFNPETELHMTIGISEALYLALAAIRDPGDEVIVPTPCFVSYAIDPSPARRPLSDIGDLDHLSTSPFTDH